MKSISLPDAAFEILTEHGGALSFKELYKQVCKKCELTPEEEVKFIGHFYTDLSLEGRFMSLTDNVWDLRSRYKYKDVLMNRIDVYSSDDLEGQSLDAEDLKEQKEEEIGINGYTLDQTSAETSDGEGYDTKDGDTKESVEAFGLDD